MNELIDWVNEQLANAGWGNNELARRAGLSSGGVSRVLAGHRSPGLEFCTGIATAFGADPVHVLRLAGLLPALPQDRAGEDHVLYEYRQLSPENKKAALSMLRGLSRDYLPPGIPPRAMDTAPESTAPAKTGSEPGQKIEQMFYNVNETSPTYQPTTREILIEMLNVVAKLADADDLDAVADWVEQQSGGPTEENNTNEPDRMDTSLPPATGSPGGKT